MSAPLCQFAIATVLMFTYIMRKENVIGVSLPCMVHDGVT